MTVIQSATYFSREKPFCYINHYILHHLLLLFFFPQGGHVLVEQSFR